MPLFNETGQSRAAKLSLLLAFGVAANLLELIIPRIPFFPWIKIGLANTFTIAAIVLYSPMEGVRISILRTFMAGFLSGIPVTSFLFSGAGGIVSAAGMGIAWKLLGKRRLIGLVGIGVIGACLHNVTQLMVAYHLFVKNAVFLWQLPLLLLFSIASGSVVGLISFPVIQAFQKASPRSGEKTMPKNFSMRHRIGLPVFLVFVIGIFFVKDLCHLGSLLGLTLLAAILNGVGVQALVKTVGRFWPLYLWNILVNLFFVSGRYVFWVVTYEGIEIAGQLVLRLIVCISASMIFMKTSGLDYPLSLLSKTIGGENLLEIVSGAFAALPKIAGHAGKNKLKTLTRFKAFVTESLNRL